MTVQELLQGEHAVEAERYVPTVHFHTETIGERGRVLPVGQVHGGVVCRDFSFRFPDTDLALKIGEIKTRPGLANKPGAAVAAVLAESLESLLGRQFVGKDAIADGEKALLIESLSYADIVYLILYRAMERRALRDPVSAPSGLECPRCHKPIREMRYDLSKTIVACWNWTIDAPPRVVAALSRPWQVGSSTTHADRVVMGPPSWGRSVKGLSEAEWRNDARIDLALAAASIVAGDDGIEGGMLTAPDPSMLGSIPEWDLALLGNASRHCGGDILPFCPIVCSSCEAEIPLPLTWRQVGFF